MKLGSLYQQLKQLEAAKQQEAVLTELIERNACEEQALQQWRAMRGAAQREIARLEGIKL